MKQQQEIFVINQVTEPKMNPECTCSPKYESPLNVKRSYNVYLETCILSSPNKYQKALF